MVGKLQWAVLQAQHDGVEAMGARSVWITWVGPMSGMGIRLTHSNKSKVRQGKPIDFTGC